MAQAEQPLFTALMKGTSIEVFNARTGIRLYTISLGNYCKVTAGPYIYGDLMTVYVQDASGTRCLKTFNAKTGVLRYTVSV